MSKTQYFVWKKRERPVAILEVRHQKQQMLLSVFVNANLIREKMAQTDQASMYPYSETRGVNQAEFLISNTGNWNCRWRDLITMINSWLKLEGREFFPGN